MRRRPPSSLKNVIFGRAAAVGGPQLLAAACAGHGHRSTRSTRGSWNRMICVTIVNPLSIPAKINFSNILNYDNQTQQTTVSSSGSPSSLSRRRTGRTPATRERRQALESRAGDWETDEHSWRDGASRRVALSGRGRIALAAFVGASLLQSRARSLVGGKASCRE